MSLEPSSGSENMSGGDTLCGSGVPVACQTHPLAGPNVACDTSHPITLPYRWPAAYVCRVHHWIPNQTLSGVITVWAPNPLWNLALSHSTTIHLMQRPHRLTVLLCTNASMCCVLKMLLFLVHLYISPGWGPEITLLHCSLRPANHSPSLGGLTEIRTAGDLSSLEGIRHFYICWDSLWEYLDN